MIVISDEIGSCFFRTEPKNSETEPDRTERLFKNFEPNRIEPKNSQPKPNRTEPDELSFKTGKDKTVLCRYLA